MPILTTLRWAPPPFQGQVRDLAVRWALEELGVQYDVRLLGPEEQRAPAHRARQPFGQVPVYEEGDLVLFETGAIVQHLGERSWLLPQDPPKRAHARAWIFAALNSVDPDIIALADIDHFATGHSWAQARRPQLVEKVRTRLDQVAAALGERHYLVGDFCAADMVMIMVLRALRHTTLVTDNPILRVYRDRCEARTAFQRALAAQLHTFAEHAPCAA
jgi:glutathione S-transferase